MVRQEELTKEALMLQIADEHGALATEIMKANRNLAERAKSLGFTFDLDKDADILTITIGEGANDSYTQGLNHVYLDLEPETNLILGFTILEFQAFLKTEEGKQLFSDDLILPVLLKYGTLSFHPEREGTRIAATELRSLVPA